MILSNQAKCKECEDVIVSKYTHDYVTCSCGAISVDGGLSYLKRVGRPEDIIEQSVEMDNALGTKLRHQITDMIALGKNSLGILCGISRTLRDCGCYIGNHQADEDFDCVMEPHGQDDMEVMKRRVAQVDLELSERTAELWSMTTAFNNLTEENKQMKGK